MLYVPTFDLQPQKMNCSMGADTLLVSRIALTMTSAIEAGVSTMYSVPQNAL